MTDTLFKVALALATSAARGASLFAYYLASALGAAKVLFSKGKAADLVDPPVIGNKKPLERGHRFPKRYLPKIGVKELRGTNQITNYVLVEWHDNIAISEIPPNEYRSKYPGRFASDKLKSMTYWHPLPERWQEMDYQSFLVARRPMIAQVIKQDYHRLVGAEA